MRLKSLLGMLLLAVAAGAAADSAGDAILGTWLTDDGQARVQISEDHGQYSGHVVWLKESTFPAGDPGGMGGKPKVDRLNPNQALRTQPIIGLTMITGLHQTGGNEWQGGHFYVPEKGKSYPCKITLAPDGTLKVSVGSALLHRTVVWTRVAPQ